MAPLPTIIAVNQTASPLVYTNLGVTVPASSQLTLTDFLFVWEIQSDEELQSDIAAGNVLLNDGSRTLTLNESLNFATSVVSTKEPGLVMGGPGSSVDNAIALFSGTDGYTLKTSSLTMGNIPDGYFLVRSGSEITGSSSTGGGSGGSFASTISSWTADSGLFRADVSHNLNTTDVIVHTMLSVTNETVGVELIERTDVNTVRIWVALQENLRVLISQGAGDAGTGGNDPDAIHDNVAGEIAAVTEKTNPVGADLFLIEDSEDSNNKKRVQLGNIPVTFRIPHTWAISGEVSVPSGDVDFIIPFFVSLASGQTATLVKARHRINSGTSVTCSLQRNDVNITGFTGISVTTTEANTDPSDVALSDDDKLALVVTGVSGTPTNLSFTIFWSILSNGYYICWQWRYDRDIFFL